MKNTFFSIVLPVYNVEKYLDRCLFSITDQKFDDIEIIIVNDGSTDKSLEIASNWEKKDKRIKIINKNNAGLGMARNTGLEYATGKYVWFIDSDDYVENNSLNEIYNELKKDDYDAVFFGFSRINQKNKKVFSLIPNTPQKNYKGNKNILNDVFPYFFSQNPITGISYGIRVSAWSCCFSTKFLKENKFEFVSERKFISEDVYFFVEIFRKINKISFIEKSLYCYCMNGGSLTFTYREDRYEKIKFFTKSVCELSDTIGYNHNVILSLKDQFLSNVIGCLKMSAGCALKKGFSYSYSEFKNICSDDFLIDILNELDLKMHGTYWRMLKNGIIKKKYLLIYITSLFIYVVKGI